MGCIQSKEITTTVEIRRKKRSMRERISGFILKKRNKAFKPDEEQEIDNSEPAILSGIMGKSQETEMETSAENNENDEIVYDSLPEENYSYSLRCEELATSVTDITDISDCSDFKPLKTSSTTSADTEETSTESSSSLSDISANTWTGEVNVLPGRSTEIAGPSIGVVIAWQEDIATESSEEEVNSSSDEQAPQHLPPPRGDLQFRYPKYRVESYSTTSPSHAGICNDTDQDVPEYTLPEETTVVNADSELDGGEAAIALVSNIPTQGVAEHSNIGYVRKSDAKEARKTCHTSSRYVAIPLTIPGAICSPPPTPPPPPSTPLQGQELNGRVDKLFDNQLQQSQPRQRVMRPKAARLPRSIPIMPTLGLPPGQDALERFAQFPQARHDQREGIDRGREQALGIQGTSQQVSPNSPDREGGRWLHREHGHRHSRDKRRTDGGENTYTNDGNKLKHRRHIRDQSRKRQKDRRRPDSGEQSKPESDGGSCCRDRGKSQRRSNRGEQSNSGSGNLSHTRDKRYSSGGNGYHSPEKKHWHPDRGKGQERPDSAEYSSSDRGKKQRRQSQGEEHWHPDRGKGRERPDSAEYSSSDRSKKQRWQPQGEEHWHPDRGKALRYPDRGKNHSRPDSVVQRYPDRGKALRYPDRDKNHSRPDSVVQRYPDRGKALRHPERDKNQSRPDSRVQRYPDRGKNQSRPDSGAQRYPGRGSGHRHRDRGCLEEDDEDSDNDFDWGCD